MLNFRCDKCGRFIPVRDLDNGKAIIQMTTPDSQFTKEEFEKWLRKKNYEI